MAFDDLLLYTRAGRFVDVRLCDETVWLTQEQMGLLFGCDKRTISEHISHIFDEGELEQEAVVRKFRTTAADGKLPFMRMQSCDKTLPQRITKSVSAQ